MTDRFAGLDNFRRKVKNLSNIDNVSNDIINYGVNYAKGLYAGTEFIVYKDNKSIVAEGEGIIYQEYGTGREGEKSNYPKDKLPQNPIKLENGTVLPKWIYYYPNKRTKRTVNGVEGWFVPKSLGGNRFRTGNPAGAEMWRTASNIRLNLKAIVKKSIKGE